MKGQYLQSKDGERLEIGHQTLRSDKTAKDGSH